MSDSITLAVGTLHSEWAHHDAGDRVLRLTLTGWVAEHAEQLAATITTAEDATVELTRWDGFARLDVRVPGGDDDDGDGGPRRRRRPIQRRTPSLECRG